MFTPPPSPQPSRTEGFHTTPPILAPNTDLHNSGVSDHLKRRTGRRFLWAIILLPLILISFTVCGRFSTSLVQTSSSLSPSHLLFQSMWKREPSPQSAAPPASSSPASSAPASSASSSPTSVASQPLPTVPSAPPPLMTPFPQPFDSIIPQNFSSSSCSNFFSNMTTSPDFRQCRPFSFLQSTSSIFIDAQNNSTLLNSLIWGTCNTPLSYADCQSNMEKFASSLSSECSTELNKQNLLVVNSLTALNAFKVMHDAACQVDPTTNAYCFVSAAQNSNPSDLYFYSVPLGIPLPTTTVPTCSGCSKSIMSIYATALQTPSQAALLTGLQSAYQASAEIAVQFCGAAFARTKISAAVSLSCGWPTIFIGFVLTWILAQVP